MIDQLYIEIELTTGDGIYENASEIFTTIKSFTALYVYIYLGKPENIKLNFVLSKIAEEDGKIRIRPELMGRELTKDKILCTDSIKEQAILDLHLPVYSKEGDTFTAGMCAVCREIILRHPYAEMRKLLGFKESCLLAPSEASVWTRFCEVDIENALSEILKCTEKGGVLVDLPAECVRFENHMSCSVRMHNIYKLARERANGESQKKVTIECQKVPKEQLDIEHKFAEGVNVSIADIILYPSIRLIYHYCDGMLAYFPLTRRWMEEIDGYDSNCRMVLNEYCIFPNVDKGCKHVLKIPKCDVTSLYKSDPKRYKPRNRIFTEQKEVDAALLKLESLKSMLGIEFTSKSQTTFNQFKVDWERIEPSHAESSALPEKRLQRKRHQLENLANAVVSLSKQGDRIVDFCSGTGHLGILLALQLPLCTIILMENKSISLQRAKQRARELNLKNLRFYHCNIDYFEGSFDIGCSLHACGTATDIVLTQCRRAKAKFVCCPCCYGSLQPMPHIRYPLSKEFRSIITEREFMYIAHTADQAHALGTLNCSPETIKQGSLCMDIVDTDRKLLAENAGYSVTLTRLRPEDCTPKNRLLVGSFTS